MTIGGEGVAWRLSRRTWAAFKERVAELVTPGVEVTVREVSIDPPITVRVDGPGVQAAARAFARAFGRQPVFVRSGGGNLVLKSFQDHLGVELIASGFGLPDDHLHSPNEKLDVAQFEGGIKTTAALLEEPAGSRRSECEGPAPSRTDRARQL